MTKNENASKEKILKYLKRKKYEVQDAGGDHSYITFIPYNEHVQVMRHLKRNNIKFTYRFNHDYSIAIYCF